MKAFGDVGNISGEICEISKVDDVVLIALEISHWHNTKVLSTLRLRSGNLPQCVNAMRFLQRGLKMYIKTQNNPPRGICLICIYELLFHRMQFDPKQTCYPEQSFYLKQTRTLLLFN